MTMSRIPALAAVGLAGALALGACSSTSTTTSSGTTAPTTAMATTTVAPTGTAAATQKDIVDTAVAAGSFKTLTKLVTDAGLVDTLKGTGPFTVFAPTDDAFAKVPAATLEALAKDPAKLKAVLTYHVLAGEVLAKDVKPGEVKTVEGENVKITGAGSDVMVNDAKVVKTDIKTSNGVIHVIDTVLLPPSAG
jgi:uncharacterized surface protein with fasciclin (FAS1) repeats